MVVYKNFKRAPPTSPLGSQVITNSMAGDAKEPVCQRASFMGILIEPGQSFLEDLCSEIFGILSIVDTIANIVVDARKVMVIDGGESLRLGHSTGNQRLFV
jgi:hypothetical protein